MRRFGFVALVALIGAVLTAPGARAQVSIEGERQIAFIYFSQANDGG